MSDEPFLSRWSRRKKESTSIAGTAGPTADVAPSQEGAQSPVPATPAEIQADTLPPVESLTPESDFTPFMKAEVDPGLKRQAFKKLIEDPRFNVMDGLDVYIDDYSKPDPLPEGWLEKMNAVKYLGIFKPSPEEAEAGTAPEPAATPEPLRNSMPDQQLAQAGEALPPDTSSAETLPSGVGKPGPAGNGA